MLDSSKLDANESDEEVCSIDESGDLTLESLSFSEKYKLSVAPPDIQLYDEKGLARAERIKEII